MLALVSFDSLADHLVDDTKKAKYFLYREFLEVLFR